MTDGEVITFKIDRLTPDTIPMARLAEYMRLLAELYGERGSVHFKRVRKGSMALDSYVRSEAMPKVVRRLALVKSPVDAPGELTKSFREIDDRLREDNASAVILRPDVGKIVEFPGRKMIKPDPITVVQPTVVDGVVVKIGGVDETIPMVIQDAEGQQYRCNINGRARARELAKYLFGGPIRVSGSGKWTRDSDGDWSLDVLNVSTHEELEDVSLDDAVQELRNAAADGWKPGAMQRWKREREG